MALSTTAIMGALFSGPAFFTIVAVFKLKKAEIIAPIAQA
jgi:hypothetical protein